MSEYIIYTDSGCDLAPEIYAEWGVPYKQLTFRFEGNDTEYADGDIPSKEFYEMMRGGAVAKTSAVNVDTFAAEFEKYLAEGTDVLYLGFSSGLSTTYNSGRLAAEQLSEKYPDRKILTVDSLAASAGQGLLLYLAVQKKREGATIEELAAYLEETKLHLSHWFTVDDLVYLKRGGRVSAAAAFFGNALGIKPVLHVDNEGHLIPIVKVRGRKTSLKTMVDKYTETAIHPEEGPVFICHGDCINDAEALAALVKERHGVDVMITTNTGTVIGAHSGPGTLALFFLAKER